MLSTPFQNTYILGDENEERRSYLTSSVILPVNGSITDERCEINRATTKNSTTSMNFEEFEISEVLKSIRLLLNYIKNGNKKGASLIIFSEE